MTVPDILQRITEARRLRFGLGAESVLPDAESAREPIVGNPFVEALAARRGRAIIAEVKMGSPKLGDLRGRIDPRDQARLYAKNGAAALSVVVEPDFFFGSFELLAECKEASGLPAVAKDFLVHPRQVEDAAAAGADAVLLIAALYDRGALAAWADLARSRGLVPLVETHAAADAGKLGGRDWELVGVNNRDLTTFEVDLEHSMERLADLPPGAVKVAESGIRSGRDVEKLAAAGFDAFLVGESLLLADDPAAKLKELVGLEAWGLGA